MSHRGFMVTAVTSAAALTALTLGAGTPSMAGQVHAAVMTSPAGQSRQVMLITGDVVNLTTLPDGRQTASVVRAHNQGPGGQFQTFNQGTDLYVVPQSAVPYLGSTLSPSLFDVTQLAQQEHGTRSLTVQLTLRSAAGPATVPGITVTHRSGTAATGRVTAASARVFGTALARQAGRDHASATHTTGLFADVANIGLTGSGRAAAAARARPDFQMYTLTLKGITPAGRLDTGDLVVIYNVYNLLRYSGFAVFDNGRAKVSVPAGRYAAICFFFNYATGAVAGVTVPQFTVSSDASSVTLDGRTATSAVSVSTPRPADPAINEVTIGRSDHSGQVGSYSFTGGNANPFTVTPVTTRVTVGQLYYYFYSRLFSPPGTKTPYSYDVEFPTEGVIPADQHYAARPGGLATVRSSYPADHRDTSALDTRFGALPWQTFLIALDEPLTTPLQRTEYYTAVPGLSWEAVYWAVFSASPFELLGELNGSWITYHPGTSSATTWGGPPQHPRLLETPLYPGQVYCPACISGGTLALLVFPFSDNSPQHRGYPDASAPGLTESESYDVYADGAEVAKGTGFLQTQVTLPAGTRHVRIDYDTTRSSPYFTLSTSAATRWTVRTGAPAGPLPRGWYCGLSDCAVLPLMFADYSLPVNLLGQLSPGPVRAGILVSHLVGAADVAVKSLDVAVSFNGGTSWQRAAVSPEGNGRYAVSYVVPAAAKTDGFGALRLVATDAYGGTLTQTIQHAFAVAAS